MPEVEFDLQDENDIYVGAAELKYERVPKPYQKPDFTSAVQHTEMLEGNLIVRDMENRAIAALYFNASGVELRIAQGKTAAIFKITQHTPERDIVFTAKDEVFQEQLAVELSFIMAKYFKPSPDPLRPNPLDEPYSHDIYPSELAEKMTEACQRAIKDGLADSLPLRRTPEDFLKRNTAEQIGKR